MNLNMKQVNSGHISPPFQDSNNESGIDVFSFTPCQHGHHELVSVLNRLAASRLQKQLQVWLAKGSKNKRAYSYQLEQCWYSKPQQCSLLQHHSALNMYTPSERAMLGFASQFIAMHHAISKIRLALMFDDLVAWVLQMEWCRWSSTYTASLQ